MSTTDSSCLDVRRSLGAEPHSRDAAILAHCRVCAACAAFLRDMLLLDARLARALAVPVPEDLEPRIVFRAAFRRRPPRTFAWLAAAASLLLAVAAGVGFGLWQNAQRSTAELGTALIAHVRNPEEAAALAPDRPLLRNTARVRTVIARVGLRLKGNMHDVTYARVCPFRGELVAHLVVRGRDGPVTVLLLPHIHVSRPMHFEEQGYRGLIVPAGGGSLAILANNPTPMRPIETHFENLIQWSL